MSHPITMIWFNQTADTLAFAGPAIVDGNGTVPAANPATMRPDGTAAVGADQTGNLRPGPQGSYAWRDAIDAGAAVSVTYHHPAGKDQTSVGVACGTRYEVCDEGGQWAAAKTFTNLSLQQEAATISLYLRRAGGVVPPPPPPPVDGLIPLTPDMHDKAAFVNSLFTAPVRDSTKNALYATIDAGALVYPYADETSALIILDAWLAAWKKSAGDAYDPGRYAQCPAQDAAFIAFLVVYIKENALDLCLPALTLKPGQTVKETPPVYESTGYARYPFLTEDSAWIYGSDWADPLSPAGQTVSAFLYLCFFGAHTVVVSSSEDGGGAVQNFHAALKAALPYRKDLYNSHYGKSGGMSGVYYAPAGAPTPEITPGRDGRDVEALAASDPPGTEPLLFAAMTAETASLKPNAFLQFEGWPSQDVLLPKPGGARHSADYQANETTFWNFSTFGACAYSEKRSTPAFLAQSNFSLAIVPATGMPSYRGAGSLQDWMHPDLIDNKA